MTNKILANFILDGRHLITLNRTDDGHSVTCDTCSLSAAVAAVVKLMHGQNVHHVTIDGANVDRV
jgi:hypothetical protein